VSSWQQEGLQAPSAVREANRLLSRRDGPAGRLPPGALPPGSEAKVAGKALYQAYLEWCETNREPPLTQQKPGDRLREKGLAWERGTGGT